MLKPGDQVSVYVSLSRTYLLADDASAVATAMGVSLDTLSGIVNDGDDWEPEETTLSAMADRADIHSEEWDVEEIAEG